VRVERELSSTRNELRLIISIRIMPIVLLQLLLQRTSSPRQSDLVVAVFIEPFAVAASRFLFTALDFSRFTIPAKNNRQ
jgi:hypothetical protein